MYGKPHTKLPDPAARDALEQISGAECRMCWTCGTCDLECPLNIAAGRLRPQKINRLASFGWIDELVSLPEIWYCLQCRRCDTVCPNKVKPAHVVEFAREEACRMGILRRGSIHRYMKFYSSFQRVRWHAAEFCMRDEFRTISAERWSEWISAPVRPPDLRFMRTGLGRQRRNAFADCSPFACFTCAECSGACPIFCDRTVFDPQAIVRMAALGMVEELLHSPSIWLCLECGRCRDACSQRVSALGVIERLKALARSEGVVDREFPLRLETADKVIYPKYIDQVDRIFKY